ncbi:MAG: Asp-tRNA(Asn)/Glu-tRNA(Gln) amidotransferase subunit GatB [Bacteroidota bacterium]
MESIYDKYETVIGLEIHVQLNTASKAFCSDDTRFGAPPNTHVSAISLGHPGTLPRTNDKQVEYAVRLGLALGCQISRHNSFDRKNYFYADLPKGYQITQDRQPICVGGDMPIYLQEAYQSIRIHHIHMEEDAGKSIHDTSSPHSLIDLNRAGVPLLEIVTEPDLRSPEEVDALMSGMRQLVRFLGISDGNMEEGSLRCDCNVSVRRKGSDKLGERCEIKNLNSMRFARRAIEYERKRQIELLESGGTVDQQTLNFDPETGVTSPLRSKEDAHDYRYFPEPDLPPIHLQEEWIQRWTNEQPALPWELFRRFQTDFGLSAYDSRILSAERDTAEYFLELAKLSEDYKALANLCINKILPHLHETNQGIANFAVPHAGIINFVQLIRSNKVSSAKAYQHIFPELVQQPEQTPLAIAQRLNLLQTDDSDLINQLVDDVLTQYPDKVQAYQKGKKGLIGFFMGEVMKRSKGKANPKMTQKILRDQLS